MLQPFLFIGVGGSGGDTLGHLRRELTDRLRRVGVRKMPPGWQFLHIDSRFTEEQNDALPGVPDGGYLGLARRDVSYRTIANYIGNTPDQVRNACAGWLPDPDKVNVAIEQGAGQYRAIGRAVAIPKLTQIHDRIKAAIQRLEQADVKSTLDDVYLSLSGEQSQTFGPAPTPVVIVFASLAGGTGSGIFLDVCDLLRGFGRTWTANSVAVLYAPDVFDGLRSELRRGVQANALATVSELLSGHWLGAPGPDPVHEAAGAVFEDMRRSGPAQSFLVGASNGPLTFQDQQDVFAVVGRTVAAWATSPAIQRQFSSYVQSNWQQGADRPDPLGLVPSRVDMPFSSLGYASVSLGRGLFRQYAAQCLARVTAERLLGGMSGEPTGEGLSGPDAEALVRQRRMPFIKAMLDLTDGGHEDLFSRLSPGREQLLSGTCTSIRSVTGATPKSFDDWRSVLVATVTERQVAFAQAQSRELRERAESWIERVRNTVRDEVRRSIAADGLLVTERLVRAMSDFLSKEEIPTLEANALQDENAATGFAAEIEKAIGTEPPKRFWRSRPLLPAENERVVHATSRGVETGLGRQLDATVRRLCVRLLRDVVDNLLRPMATELSRALRALRRDTISPGDGKPALVEQWPQAPTYPVPLALRPSLTQFVVDYVDEYPRVFAGLMGAAVGDGTLPLGDSMPRAVRRILFEDWEYNGSTFRLMEQTATWQPEIVREWSNLERVGTTAAFRIQVSGENLLDRCDAWLMQSPGLGTYVRQSLTEALGGAQPTQEQQERLDRYTTEFEKAIVASAPLVRLDPAHVDLYMDAGASAFQPLISQVPLEADSVAYQRTRQLLLRLTNLSEARLDNLFSTTGANEIEFTSFLNAPCHPTAFSSLTTPIKSDWLEKGTDPGRRLSFSKWRRARPLPRAVPLPQDVRRSMVRGWLVTFATSQVNLVNRGQHLQVTREQSAEGIVAVRVDPPLDQPYTFPLIGREPDERDPLDTLASVVESLPLVLLEPPNRDSDSLKAFRHLLSVDSDALRGRFANRESVANLVKVLRVEAERRLPADAPHNADRLWDLRDDVLDALATLDDVLRGEPAA